MAAQSKPLAMLEASVAAYRRSVTDARVPSKVRAHDLRHMAFWHAYYAGTVTALAAAGAPDVLRGTYKAINRQAQLDYARHDEEALLAMIAKAQERLLATVPGLSADQMIPYKKGSRDYRRDDYVETVAGHFDMHTRYLDKIAAGAPESFYVFHI